MHLRRIEICGFKSFARATVLDFPSSISAIIGPNGSGKSNIVEAIRWALGEQSFKSLRTKRGEDLIFNGTPGVSRSGKARVMLVFDNSAKKLPLDYEEVIVERSLYRDGINEYFLNNSSVRLKDVVELFSNASLGASQHYIVSQGAADRFLSASPFERKNLIEEALGLGAFQIKLARAGRKIKKTKDNISQIQILKEELRPHLKFLKSQTIKFEKTRIFKEELKKKYEEYLRKELIFLKKTANDLNFKKADPSNELSEILERLRSIKEKLEKHKSADSRELEREKKKLLIIKESLDMIQRERIGYERRLGKIEGVLDFKKESKPRKGKVLIEFKKVERFIDNLQGLLKNALETKTIENVHHALKKISFFIKNFFYEDINNETFLKNKPDDLSDEISKLEEEKKNINFSIRNLLEKEAKLKKESREMEEILEEKSKLEREMENERYLLESRANDLKDYLRSFEFQEEKLRLRKEEFEREKREAQMEAQFRLDLKENFLTEPEKELISQYNDEARSKFQRVIEKIKLKIEESGGINSEVIKEYEEVRKRDEFFARELEDLNNSLYSLRNIIRELQQKIKFEFKNGLERINKEFNEFFKAIFGGGRAELKLKTFEAVYSANNDEVSDGGALEEPEDEHQIKNNESGLEIFVNLPRKRIGSLSMLSGGERSLTAIALLCAVTYVNPPPFLIMDEIDAALDEINSKRCGELLDILSKKTQLIVITHNREIIKRAGVLYGVTMSKDGISKLLSVKLE
jgi:chromosome segregation protein